MSDFRYKVLSLTDSNPKDWLKTWSDKYDAEADQQDKAVYDMLIRSCDSFAAEHFVEMGKWKDAALGTGGAGRWKPNVASVAYEIWVKASQEIPSCPAEANVADFLTKWATQSYTDVYPSGLSRKKCFGLSRASTMLHFLTGGQYPIFDSRVRTAMHLLDRDYKALDEATHYVDCYYPRFLELAEACNTSSDLRKLDKALFAYGSTPYSYRV